jgi:hypothetical protein
MALEAVVPFAPSEQLHGGLAGWAVHWRPPGQLLLRVESGFNIFE